MRVPLVTALLLAGSALCVIPTAKAQESGNMTGLKSHPCVLVSADGLAALRAKCADSRVNKFGFDTASVWADIKKQADALAEKPTYSYSVRIPGVAVGFLEDWSYTLSDQTPPNHDKSPAYPPWTAMFQERADSITTRLVNFSFAYLVTGETKYFEKAREIALHLTHWSQWTDPSYTAGRIKACLDTGHCTYAMGMFYDWCYDRLSAQERQQVRDALLTKGIDPILSEVDKYPPDTNGYAVLTTGAIVAAIAVRPEEPSAGAALATCVEKIRTSLSRGGKDGGAFEGPMYGTYLLDSFALALDALTSARVEHSLFEHPYLATMSRYCLGLLSPDTHQIPNFSDGSPGVGFLRLMQVLAQRGSTEAAYYLEQAGGLKVSGIYDLVRFDETKLNPVRPAWNPSSVFVDIGYASLRDGYNAKAPSLFFKSGPLTNNIGHNHFDHNAFVISEAGEWVICDRGYHDFYVPPRTKFSLGSIGHCTVVLDLDDAYFHDNTVPSAGHDQVKRYGGQISEFFAGEGFDWVKGRAADAYNTDDLKVLDQFDRGIVYVKPDFFVVRDQLAAPKPHRYSFLLHTDGLAEITPKGDAFNVTRSQSEVFAQIAASTKTQSFVQTYPGAEDYGPFLRVETEPATTATFTALLWPHPYSSPTVLRNGGFERGLSGWIPRAGEDAPNHKIVTENPAEGSQCAQLEKSGYYYSSRFSLPVGTKITARAKIRTTQLPEGRGAMMTLYFWRAGTAFASKSVGPFAHTDWQEHTLTTTVPEGTEDICLALTFSGPGTTWFDAAQVEAEVPVKPTPKIENTSLGNNGLSVLLEGRRSLVVFGDPGKVTSAGDVSTDGELAVVQLDAQGKAARVFLKGGSYVQYGGSRLLSLQEPGTAEALLSGDSLRVQVTQDVTPHAPLADQAIVTVGLSAREATLNGRPARLVPVEGGVRVEPGA